MSSLLNAIFVPLMVFITVFAVIIVVMLYAKRYIRVGPNQAAVIFGRKREVTETLEDGSQVKKKVGFRTICGGSTFVWPIFEKVDYLDLTSMNITVKTVGAITRSGVPLTVNAIANVKIGSDDLSLRNAAERLLGKSEDEIRSLIGETLEAHLRSICGTLEIEQINSDRQAFSQQVTTEAAQDLKKLGIIIDMIPIKHIEDELDYIKSLGRKKTAEVKRDADIGVSEAERDSAIKSTDAHREGEIVKNENLAQEAASKKDREVKSQDYQSQEQAAKAKAEQAGPLAKAKAEQEVVVEQAKVREVQTKAEIEVEKQEIEKQKKTQEATIVVPAQAAADALVKSADGYKVSEIAKADGDKQAMILKADGARHKFEQEGLGKAAATEAEGLAKAIVEKQLLLAKAEGLEKIADAYKKFNTPGLVLEISKQLPQIIESLAPVMAGIAAPMGNIDKVVVVDSGGNGDGKSGALSRFSQTVPNFLFNLFEQASAQGVNLSNLAGKIGIKLESDSAKAITDQDSSSQEKTKQLVAAETAAE